jgi:hypothetical protein
MRKQLHRLFVFLFELAIIAGGVGTLIWQLEQPRIKVIWLGASGFWIAIGVMLLLEDIQGGRT